MFTNGETYRDLGGDCYQRRDPALRQFHAKAAAAAPGLALPCDGASATPAREST
jgi:hypothetical protein